MQVDWVSGIVEARVWPGYQSGLSLKLGPDGEVLQRWMSPMVVRDYEPSSARSITVWTPTPGALYLSGNPVKLLQGHNLWGSLDPAGLYLEAGVWVRQRVGLFPAPATWAACGFVGPRYTRLDITRSYRFPTDADAAAFVRWVAGGSRSRHGQATLYSDSTAYFGQHSRRWTMKVYCKRQELLRRVRELPRPRLDELLTWAVGVVRFEVTLRRPELERWQAEGLDLNKPAALREIWQHYYGAITWSRQAMNRDLFEQAMSRHLRGTLAMWERGDDLRAILPRPTFYRHRLAILKAIGIDIANPPLKAAEAVASELDPAGWDPEPIAGGMVEPRQQLKLEYGRDVT